MTVEELEEVLFQGVANDIFMAQYHYFIFRTLGENSNRINDIEDEAERKNFTYIQSSSRDLAILHLTKVFDKRNATYKTLSIPSLLQECANFKSEHFPLKLKVDYLRDDLLPYPAINNISKHTKFKLDIEGFADPTQLTQYLSEVLRQPNVITALKNLKTARDKTIAHNEYMIEALKMNNFWNDYAFMLTLARLYSSVISEVFANINLELYVDLDPQKVNLQIILNGQWIVEKLDRSIGSEDLNVWWN